ncbi:MAG: ComEC/Rec2 family competence protein [Spirochaetales bacterium]|nr:ComEC/Rec2 family competence protein [Spirochaetales bacterium]
MLDSLLLGRTYRAGQLKEEFRLAGLSHLLALSGLHLGIVSTLVFLILRFILPCRARGPVLLMLLCFYSYLIGLKHSFLRAVIMYGLFSLLQLKDIKPVSWKVMVLSALIQSFIWKGSYRSWSFILSYAAMGGILGFYRPWLCVFRRILPKVLALPLAVSCAAQTVIIPLVLPFFGWIQPVGVIAGLILTPLITVYLWAGLLYIPLIMIFPGLKDWGAGFFRVIHELIMILVRFFGRVSPVQWESPAGKLLFFLTLSATIVPFVLLLVKEVRFGGKKSQIKLRFPFGNKSTFGNDGAGAQKEMGAEFSHQ